MFVLFVLLIAVLFVAFSVFTKIFWESFLYSTSKLGAHIIRSCNTFEHIWFNGPGDVIFHLLRHAAVAVAMIAELYFVNIGWINTAVLVLHLLYALIGLPLFSSRRKSWKELSKGENDYNKVMNIAWIAVLFPFIMHIVLMAAYGFRP